MHWDGNNVWQLLGDANHHFNLYGLNIFISLERDEADCRAFLTFPPTSQSWYNIGTHMTSGRYELLNSTTVHETTFPHILHLSTDFSLILLLSFLSYYTISCWFPRGPKILD
jgi:hypothetical protein